MAQTTMIVFDCRTPAAPVPIARFTLGANGDGLFGYGKRYLERPGAFSIDPRHLPLLDKDQLLPRQPDSTYGVLSDAGPNAWGAKLTAYLLRRDNKALPENPVEWFLQSKHFGSGCLAFAPRPDEPPRLGEVPVRSSDLSARVLDALKIYLTDPNHKLDDETIQLLFPGSDLGGLRPKTIVMHDGHEHIAKFERPDDHFNVPAAEYATLRPCPYGRDQRAELRTGAGRRSLRTAGRALRPHGGLDENSLPQRQQHLKAAAAEPRPARVQDLVLIRRDCGGPAPQEQRRSGGCARALPAHGAEHHGWECRRPYEEPRPADEGTRSVPPVAGVRYLPAPQRALSPPKHRRGLLRPASTIENAMSQCGRFFLKADEAAKIVAEVKDVASTWRQVFADSGISEADRYRLAGCFAVADQATAKQVNLGQVAGQGDELAEPREAPSSAP